MRYHNPVYPEYFADPFVWEFEGTYYAIGTGAAEAEGALKRGVGRVFPLLQSTDLVAWLPAGEALERPDPALGSNFWAPEIAYADGLFWMYYSVGHGDKHHQIRVAVADNPVGPYRDAIPEPLIAPRNPRFAIDPHPFRDDDGQWYLFFARDFLDAGITEPFGPVRAGTALAVVPLENMTKTAGEPKVVLRARRNWQRFMSDRFMYGGVFDWHTLEGPFVRKHEGRYYCFYSGGRWETDTYGVDYGVSDTVMGPYDDAGNESGPRVLRTVHDKVLGPGHNSIVNTPEGRDFIIYHAWDPEMTARRLCIDPLVWRKQGPRSPGPTWTSIQIDLSVPVGAGNNG